DAVASGTKTSASSSQSLRSMQRMYLYLRRLIASRSRQSVSTAGLSFACADSTASRPRLGHAGKRRRGAGRRARRGEAERRRSKLAQRAEGERSREPLQLRCGGARPVGPPARRAQQVAERGAERARAERVSEDRDPLVERDVRR